MAFHDVQFPVDISYGSSGGPSWSTTVLETDSAQEKRIARWSFPRYRYFVNEAVKTPDQLGILIAFYLARQGAMHSFRYKDWADYSSALDGKSTPDDEDQILGTGDTSEVNFQLVKRYTSGPTTRIRELTKIVDDTLVIALDGTPTSAYTYVGTTGIVTFNSAPGSGVAITCGYEFDVEVRFGLEADEHLAAVHEGFDMMSLQSVPLIEVLNETPIDEDFLFGGAESLSGTTTIQLTPTSGRVLSINPGVADLDVKLPDSDNLPLGGPYYWIHNIHGSYSLKLRNFASTLILSVAGKSSCMVMLGLDDTSSKKWFILTGTSNA